MQGYFQQVREELESMGCQIKTSCEIKSVSSSNGGTANASSPSIISFYYHLVTQIKFSMFCCLQQVSRLQRLMVQRRCMTESYLVSTHLML